jgi:hypothetical protein
MLCNTVKHGASMGTDGIAISANGDRLYYCPLGSRKLYSVETNVLVDRSLEDQQAAAKVKAEGDRGGASDGLESDAAGYIYSTNYEHNAILRRGPDMNGKRWCTHRQARYNKGSDLRQKHYFVVVLMLGQYCCDKLTHKIISDFYWSYGTALLSSVWRGLDGGNSSLSCLISSGVGSVSLSNFALTNPLGVATYTELPS